MTSESKLRAEEVSAATVDALMSIKVQPNQEGLIAPNAEWIAEAAFVKDSKTYGVFMDTKAVGMFSLVDPRLHPGNFEDFQDGCAFMWRIMIDETEQHKGYGLQALNLAFDLAIAQGHKGLTLSIMDDKPGNALPFYELNGFKPTGRKLSGETEMVKYAAA